MIKKHTPFPMVKKIHTETSNSLETSTKLYVHEFCLRFTGCTVPEYVNF
jgi:hypothetical protein